MSDIKKVLDTMKGLSDDEAIDKLAKMIKSGEAGVTPAQAQALANKFSPMLDSQNRQKMQKLLKKLK